MMKTQKFSNLILALFTLILCLLFPSFSHANETQKFTNILAEATHLQAIGQYTRACDLLLPILNVNNNCRVVLKDEPSDRLIAQIKLTSPVTITSARNLGNIFRVLGSINIAEKLLQKTLAKAQELNLTTEISWLHLSLAKTSIAISQKLSISQKEQLKAQNFAKLHYKKAVDTAPSPLFKAQAQLGLLSFSVQHDWDANLTEILTDINNTIASLPVTPETINMELDLAESLTCLSLLSRPYAQAEISGFETPNQRVCRRDQAILTATEMPIKLLTKVVEQAQTIKADRSLSYALGSLGEIAEINGQLATAKELTENALKLAQSYQNWEIAYQWQWQLGRILAKQAQTETALNFYQVAIASVTKVRKNLIGLNTDQQFNFRDEVEPIYRQLVDLLLPKSGTQPDQTNLQLARAAIEDLQLAELENFLGCLLLNNDQKLDTVANQKNVAVIYPIILPNRLATIVKLPAQTELLYYDTSISSAKLQNQLKEIRQQLEEPDTSADQTSELYQWLIAPAKEKLDLAQVKTLVFVLDSDLRNIPMGTLYDGKKYLIEQYAIALNIGLNLETNQEAVSKKLITSALLGGLTQSRRNLNALTYVAQELQNITINQSKKLIDSQFTSGELKAQLGDRSFSIVHLATHGKFTSQPETTVIELWDHPLSVQQLEHLFKGDHPPDYKPIELLVLSACETGKGDNRAVLGMAGITVKTGAQSTIGSLWYLNDESSAILMESFYRYLQSEPTMSKVEALQKAQVEMLENFRYKERRFWAPYILVGNWF